MGVLGGVWGRPLWVGGDWTRWGAMTFHRSCPGVQGEPGVLQEWGTCGISGEEWRVWKGGVMKGCWGRRMRKVLEWGGGVWRGFRKEGRCLRDGVAGFVSEKSVGNWVVVYLRGLGCQKGKWFQQAGEERSGVLGVKGAQ